jgi:hypothetical protein
VIQGHGTCEWTDAAGVRCVYEGGFVRGLMQGEGVLSLSSGASYRGGFHEGRLHGRGVYTWPDGAVYEGEFCEGAVEGRGAFAGGRSSEAYGCDETFEGEWAGGRRHGRGVARVRDRLTDGLEVLEGAWRAGLRHGRFRREYAWGARTQEVPPAPPRRRARPRGACAGARCRTLNPLRPQGVRGGRAGRVV